MTLDTRCARSLSILNCPLSMVSSDKLRHDELYSTINKSLIYLCRLITILFAGNRLNKEGITYKLDLGSPNAKYKLFLATIPLDVFSPTDIADSHQEIKPLNECKTKCTVDFMKGSIGKQDEC